jgi:two-component system cell cycle sensor histidine kinase/response regulator CckA
MRFDLLTILVIRLGVDLLVAFAFLALSRRQPSVGGPGWWAVAALCSAIGSIGLGLRDRAPEMFTIGAANTALSASLLFSWYGVRSHLGLSQPLGRALLALLAAFVGNAVLFALWDSVPARQTLFSLFAIGVGWGLLRDIRRHDPQQRWGEFNNLRLMTQFEVLLLGGLAVWVWFLPDNPAPMRLSSAAPLLLLAFMVDILLRAVLYTSLVTLRLQQNSDRARQALLVREADSRALIDNLGAGVMVFRPDRSLVTVNNAARHFLGWDPAAADPILARPTASDWRLVREDGRPMARHEMPFNRVLATGQPVSDVIAGLQSGPLAPMRWALCNAYPENDVQGGLRHVVVCFLDITSLKAAQAQQKALESQLAQSQNMESLGTLAGGVAHDFNNILAAILGNAELARQDLDPDSAAGASLAQIGSAARRGRELVRQIQAYSRKQPMQRRPVDLAVLLAECCKLLRAATQSDVLLLQNVAPGEHIAMADATQLGQVLLNLGTNAVHAMADRPGAIEFRIDSLGAHHPELPECLRAHPDRHWVRVRVSDSGCGMDAATRSRIFEPFFTTKAVGQGTGLGLPVVLGIVQAHEGHIDVNSEPGRGTSFCLHLPAVVPAEGGTMHANTSGGPQPPGPLSVESPAMALDPVSEQRHILYLDDDDTLVFLVRRLLERRGYKVTALSDQHEAIDAVRAQPASFDLVMTDYNMPGMSGLEVAKAVLAINPKLPVAVASGYITDELQAEALAAGVCEVVFKTDAVEAFCEVVARLVAPPRPA